MAPPRSADGAARPRVLLLLSWLNGGGAERVALHLMGHEALSGFDIRLGVLRRAGHYLDAVDPERLEHRPWAERWFPSEGSDSSFYRPHRLAMSALIAPLAYRAMIRRYRPELVLSFAKGANLAVHWAMRSLGRTAPCWIAREGNNLVRATGDEASGAIARRTAMALARSAYRAADCVLANSIEMAAALPAELGVDASKIRMIHNPVDLDAVRRGAAQSLADPPARPFIVSVGRLEHQKGHDLLLRAFAAARCRADHDLVILGDGAGGARLRSLANELGIAGKVRFEPFTQNPWAWMARARLFVLPSRWEGFPNALAEAMAGGTAALACDCRFGPNELIEHQRSGWLVPPEDVGALGEAIDLLAGDEALRVRIAAGGVARSRQLRLDAILPLYAELLREQIALRRSRAGGTRRHLAARTPLLETAD